MCRKRAETECEKTCFLGQISGWKARVAVMCPASGRSVFFQAA